MAALARRWVGKGMSIVLGHAHELHGFFHRPVRIDEAHRVHGNSSDVVMMTAIWYVSTKKSCSPHRAFLVDHEFDQARSWRCL